MQSNGTTNGDNPVEQAVEVFVYAPIGLALMAWKTVPKLVGQVLSQLGDAESGLAGKLNQARMIGQMAVAYGGHQVRREVDSRLADARRRAEVLTGRGARPDGEVSDRLAAPPPPAATTPPPVATPPPPAPPSPAAAPPPPATTTPPAPAPAGQATKVTKRAPARRAPAASPRAQDLPIPEYDGLSASQVVQRLTGLLPEELAAVRAYEASGRRRKTVLGAIDRLHP